MASLPSVYRGSPPELLAPAGTWECARAAVANGADAIYFGLPRFNARMRAENFRETDLADLMKFLHDRGRRGYLTLNTLVFPSELQDLAAELTLAKTCGVDALIVQDLGVAILACDIGLEVHASTQMTITSPEGVAFAAELGASRVVVARELSLRELAKFDGALPLEVFVHGALCVAYSGQCLTSESLGQRSANRGECAQACRMPYELIVDGAMKDLGDKRYLLSPQDLAAANEIPRLIDLGIASFKIEGRLKTPEYVAAVTQVYRRIIDDTLRSKQAALTSAERYQLEMAFSRGLFNGWMEGVNHQKLVDGRYGKKRGPFVGTVAERGDDYLRVASRVAVKPGDGLLFETGEDQEYGGRVFEVRGDALYFDHSRFPLANIRPGARVWKTDDPALMKQLRASWAKGTPPATAPIDFDVTGESGGPLQVVARCEGKTARAATAIPLQPAHTRGLTAQAIRAQLGKLGGTRFREGKVSVALSGSLILPLSAINDVRRQIVAALDAPAHGLPPEVPLHARLAAIRGKATVSASAPKLHVLCRSMDQLQAALGMGERSMYADFEDVKRYRDAVALAREKEGAEIFLATPRIQKAGEAGFFKLIANCQPDGVLIRNLGAIDFFARSELRRIGDFSLNVANAITADHLKSKGLERLTISYDLHAEEAIGLLKSAPASWFEATIHQHMPMFHMEHCVFAAFLSNGTDHTNCGRPCDSHRVHLRDRVGMEHPLRGDVGCRNTLFNSVPQTAAPYFDQLSHAGLRHFRVELLEEDTSTTRTVLRAYRELIEGSQTGSSLWRALRAQSQFGVTRGTLRSPA